MAKDFVWHWFEPQRTQNVDLELNAFKNINYKHHGSYKDFLKSLKEEKEKFGIIQDVFLKINIFQSPEFWADKVKWYNYDIIHNSSIGLDFYKDVVLKGYSKGILPPPTIFLHSTSNKEISSQIENKVGNIMVQWAEMHGLEDFNDAKIALLNSLGSYEKIQQKILEFQKD